MFDQEQDKEEMEESFEASKEVSEQQKNKIKAICTQLGEIANDDVKKAEIKAN
ncbi:MAG: hypothetical protein ACRCTY_04160 [Candidatus Adiutrix sp.]